MKQTRVIAYVDGYNVYYGFLRKNWRGLLWLDYRSLFESILLPDQQLEVVNYFTAPSRDTGSRKRQQTYHEALSIRGGVVVHEGKTVRRETRCDACGHKWFRAQEKETDVRMALEMFADCQDGLVDEVWLMSRDADLVPAVERVRERFGIKVLIVPPPHGAPSSGGGDALVAASGGRSFHIRNSMWRRHQLPNSMQREKGARRVKKPPEWS